MNLCKFPYRLPRIEGRTEPHPAVVEGCDAWSLNIIPYTKMDTPAYPLLSEELKDFFQRMSYHEYFCAVLWHFLNGNMVADFLYLCGEDSEDTSAFIRMLGSFFKNTGTYTNNVSRFSNADMFGKSILTILENKDRKVLQNPFLKSISKGDLLRIEGRWKDSFYREIRGFIVVYSNHTPILEDALAARKRLRYFAIKPQDPSRYKDFEDTLDGMSSTPNEFLNYCRECFESLAVEGGALRIPQNPNQEAVFSQCADIQIRIKQKRYWNYLEAKGFKLQKGLTCTKEEIYTLLFCNFPDKKIEKDFNNFLEVQGVTQDQKTGMFIGVGRSA